MSSNEDREVLRRISEHVRDLRRALDEGRAEINRQRESVRETGRHMDGMARWIEETERQLDALRAQRRGGGSG